uniref:Uncharacterized protein n=1 Tax=Arundo donax TaxID=35708 RepID=A0A0A8Z967_ARUDO
MVKVGSRNTLSKETKVGP